MVEPVETAVDDVYECVQSLTSLGAGQLGRRRGVASPATSAPESDIDQLQIVR